MKIRRKRKKDPACARKESVAAKKMMKRMRKRKMRMKMRKKRKRKFVRGGDGAFGEMRLRIGPGLFSLWES